MEKRYDEVTADLSGLPKITISDPAEWKIAAGNSDNTKANLEKSNDPEGYKIWRKDKACSSVDNALAFLEQETTMYYRPEVAEDPCFVGIAEHLNSCLGILSKIAKTMWGAYLLLASQR